MALENALMGHPAVLEAAVIAIPDEKWSERPLAVVVFREGQTADADELRAFLAPNFAKWWLPGAVRGRRRDPEDGGRQVPQDRAERAVRDGLVGARRATPAVVRHRGGSLGTFVTTEHEGAVALVTIDNPPMNALSAALVAELEAEVGRLDGDPETRAIVLRGAGERAFVAGADIKEFPALREAGGNEGGAARGLHAIGRRMDAAHTPFVAAINGYCLGGGLELAMCCDVRICADNAHLGQPEIKLGLIPGGGGTQRLPRLIGVGRANLLNLSGDFIDAETAYAWGLVEKVVPADELISARHRRRCELRGRVTARGGGDPRARTDDARPLARGGPPSRGRRLPPLPPLGGRARGRGRICREAPAGVHGSLMQAVVLEGIGGPEQLVLRELPPRCPRTARS